MYRKFGAAVTVAAMVGAMMLIAAGPALAYTFPSTNALNEAKQTPGYIGVLTPFVRQVGTGPGTVTLEFVGGYVGGAWFEYRLDGAVKDTGTAHPVVTGDYIYPNIGVPANTTTPQTFTANDKVEVRLALGGERDWDFDWTTFAVGPNPTLSCETGTFVDSTGGTVNLATVPGHKYQIDVSGTYYAGGTSQYDIRADAEYSQDATQRANGDPWTALVNGYGSDVDLLDLMVDGQGTTWGQYSSSHTYTMDKVATDGTLSFAFDIYDSYPSNNTGGLCVSLTDLGNVGTVTGFFAPVNNIPTDNVAKAGQSIPLKFRVLDWNGNPVSELSDVDVTSTEGINSAGVNDLLEAYASGDSGLQYLGDGYWQFNWKTLKVWAGSGRTVRLTLSGVEVLTAEFVFK
jgi:hypothetical protein